ncbi:MAG: acetate--CoA ligase [Candidatus Zixiibacteriota bacterium]
MNSAAGLDKIFRPRSIAVIGATNRPGTIGQVLTHNLITGGFTGAIFPVNPNAEVIHSIKCYPSILDVPDAVDLAIILVPKDFVLDVVEDCGRKGVGGIVVITAGFKEIGGEGVEREKKLVERARHYNMRVIGPNCFGVINTHPDYVMNATFSRTQPLRGKIGFMSQSGSLGEAILNHAKQLGIGFSMFASVGNKADVAGNALLNYWKDDPETQIILLYLESFGDAEMFPRIAKTITKVKPVIAVKSGKTTAGARATASHTGALAGFDIGVDALFEQCGVLRVQTIEELFDVAKAFDLQPLPKGKRVAVLTNAGGPGILATDASAALGLEIADLEPETERQLRSFLPPEASTCNPVDMIASATAEQYRRALELLFKDQNIDAVICVFVPPIMIDELAVADAIVDASRGATKPILSCFMGPGEGSEGAERLKRAKIPVYTFPEQIANTYALMTKYAAWRDRPLGTFPERIPGIDSAQRRLTKLAQAGHTTILGGEALEVLRDCGIPVAPLRAAANSDEAAAIAASMGYPVVLKLNAENLIHKTDIGGVITDVRTEEELRGHIDTLLKRAREHHLEGARIDIQKMISGGVEMVLGMVRDPKFGPLVMCGLGGILVEVVKDVSFKLPPLSQEDAAEMIDHLRGKRLLTGYRGSKPVDLKPITDSLLALSQLVEGFPLIQELDINPFVATSDPTGSCAIDARIILGTSA